jgi:protein involved in polysaccharide export with SLBB domain
MFPSSLDARLFFGAITSILLVGCASPMRSEFHGGHRVTKTAQSQVAPAPSFRNLPRENQKGVLASHLLEPGDVVSLEIADVLSNLEIAINQTILADGSLDLARFGRVIVAGMTLESTESLIEDTIANVTRETEGAENVLHVEANVRLTESTDRFYVLGDVRTPGIYKLKGFETVLDGILLAGGVIDNSSGYEIQLARPSHSESGQMTMPVNYQKIAQQGDSTTNYQLQPCDRIYVTQSRANQTIALSNPHTAKVLDEVPAVSTIEPKVQVSNQTLAELIGSDANPALAAEGDTVENPDGDFEFESAENTGDHSGGPVKPQGRFRPMWVR